jgi:hypothetical protein
VIDEKIKMELLDHLRNHVMYPATKKQILEQCDNMEMHTPEAKKQVEMLPEKTFRNADEVIMALAV